MKDQTKSGIDRDYLRRCKGSTTEQKLNWLAAALEFVQELERSANADGKRKKSHQ